MFPQAHYWDLSFGPVFGPAGSTTVISVNPQCRFRVEKVMATDTNNGNACRIVQFMVGNRLQKPALSGGTLAQFFGTGVLGNRMGWDVCERGLSISVTVSFIVAGTFDMTAFGKAVD